MNEVKHAINILRDELLKCGKVYDGFCASIKSALDEQENSNPYRSSEDMAKIIMNRIIGEDLYPK